MAIVEISVVPLGVEGTSVSAYVARAIEILQESSLQFELTGMGTIISGDLDAIWEVLKRMHESCFVPGVGRVLTDIRIDDRRDKAASPRQKVQSALQKLAKR